MNKLYLPGKADGRLVLRWAPYENCTAPSLLHFPYLGLPEEPALPVTLATFVLCLAFLTLTFVCTCHFLPALSVICNRMKEDVVRGTLMVVAASIPEVCISIVGTFFTEEDVGAGAIVGSAVFNTLAIPAFCALLEGPSQGNKLDTWALSRDSLMYIISLFFLMIFFANDTIQWYEALTLVSLYFAYVGGMQIDKLLKKKTFKFYYRLKEEIFEDSPLKKIGGKKCYGGVPELYSSCDEAESERVEEYDRAEREDSIYLRFAKGVGWPVNKVIALTIPTSYPWLALATSCVWIALLTYLVSWMVALIGYRLGIPDSLMAVTVLGIGVGMPELIISLNAAKRGKGTMALCSALGSNIINLLFCLAFPWLLKMAITNSNALYFNTDALSISCLHIFLTFIILYLSLMANKFVLDKKIGWLLMMLYGIFLLLSILIEMNVFFKANLPMCNIKDYWTDQ